MGGQDLKRERGKKTLGREGWRSWGEKDLKRERGKKILGRQRETNSGCEKALGGTGGKGSQYRKVGKALREEKGEDLRGEKALGGKGGKGSQAGKHLREEKGGKGI